MLTVRTEIGLVPKQDWAQTQAAQTIKLKSVDGRIRSIPEEKQLVLVVSDCKTQFKLENLSSE